MAKKKEPKAAAKSVAVKEEKTQGTPSWQTGGAVAAVLLAVMMLTGKTTNPLNYVNVSDEGALRKIFFSGDVWSVAKDEMKFAVLDCKAALPGSGRTTMQRWKLKTGQLGEPVIFVANGVGVTQIPGSAARSEYDLIREMRLAAWRRPLPIKNTEQLQEKCLSKARCVLVLKGGSELEPATEKALHHLAGAHAAGGSARQGDAEAGVAFTSLDSQDLRLSFEGYEAGEKVKLRRYEQMSHRVVYFRNASSKLYALAHKGPLSEASLGAFLAGVSHDGSAPGAPANKRLAPLDVPVTLGRRPLPKTKRKPAPNKAKEAPPPPPKGGETLSPEAREKLLNDQRERERLRRENMEREAEESGHFVGAADEDEDEDDDHYADDDEDDVMDLD